MDNTKQGKTMKRVQVYDMDGTIVDSLHRYRTIRNPDGTERIDLEYWRANEYRAMDDSLLPLAEQYKADLADPDCYVIIATARVINRPDARFIEQVLGLPDFIISRKPNDSQSGKTLKCNGLARFFNLPQFQRAEWAFYEDNLDYLGAVCQRFPKIKPVFCAS
ncbi:hypothetical protein EBT25_16760, partial [bacterium]|nr:hypothetical protein [bacterium]